MAPDARGSGQGRVQIEALADAAEAAGGEVLY